MGSGRQRVHHRQVGGVRRVAGAAHQARGVALRDPIPQHVLHLHLVAAGQHHHRGVALVRVRLAQLRQHQRQARRPSQDERVAVLDHPAPALAQLLQALVERRRDEADERAHQEQAAQGHQQRDDPETPAGVARERAGVERPPQGLPHVLDEGLVAAGEQRVQRRADHDEDGRGGREVGHQGDRAPGHGGVEPVPEPFPDGWTHAVCLQVALQEAARRTGPRVRHRPPHPPP